MNPIKNLKQNCSYFILFILGVVASQSAFAQCGPTCSAPTIQNPPPDMQILCDEPLPPLSDLYYDNGETGVCENSGFIPGMIQDNTDPCFGGTIVITWQGQDVCGNSLAHTQTITVEPMPLAMIQNPPFDMTLSCGEFPPTLTDLTYDNGRTGNCSNVGTISGTVNDMTDGCNGGTIVYTWQGQDNCGNPLAHTQTFTVAPTPPAVLINPSGDMTISCGDPIPPLIDLDFSNGDPSCSNEGVIAGSVQDMTDGCNGGTVVYTWNGQDVCGNPLAHIQTITVAPTPPAQFINPPIGITLNCGDAVPPLVDLQFDNGLTGICNNSGTISGTQSGPTDPCQGGTLVRTWTGQDACGNTLTHTQNIIFSLDECDPNNGLPLNQVVEGNLCVSGSVHASEMMRLKPRTTAPANPQIGTIYFDDNTKKLRVWDGAAWRACW